MRIGLASIGVKVPFVLHAGIQYHHLDFKKQKPKHTTSATNRIMNHMISEHPWGSSLAYSSAFVPQRRWHFWQETSAHLLDSNQETVLSQIATLAIHRPCIWSSHLYSEVLPQATVKAWKSAWKQISLEEKALPSSHLNNNQKNKHPSNHLPSFTGATKRNVQFT